jgi:hypothetical protein
LPRLSLLTGPSRSMRHVTKSPCPSSMNFLSAWWQRCVCMDVCVCVCVHVRPYVSGVWT